MGRDEDSLDYWKSLPKSWISWEALTTHPIGALLTQAHNQRCRVGILYEGFDKGPTNRLIFPLATFTVSGVIYVKAYCFLRSEERTFRLDRVKEARVVDGSFEMPPNYLEQSAPQTRSVVQKKGAGDSTSSDNSWLVWAVIIGVLVLWLLFKK